MGVYDAIKDGVKVARNAGNIELSIELARVAEDLLEKQKKIEELGTEVKELKSILQYRDQLGFDDNAYWKYDGQVRGEGPFCAGCWDSKQKLIRLSKLQEDIYACPVCKVTYYMDKD